MALVGTPSDDVEAVLATGRTDVTTVFVSMSLATPTATTPNTWSGTPSTTGRSSRGWRRSGVDTTRVDARVPSGTGGVRRALRSRRPRDDLLLRRHRRTGGVQRPRRRAGRRRPDPVSPPARRTRRLPPRRRMAAAPRVKVGADVLPWWPAKGVYLLVERGEAPATDLAEVPGVGRRVVGHHGRVRPAVLDRRDGPADHVLLPRRRPGRRGERLRPALEQRWSSGEVSPLFAAPFHTLVPHAWDRFRP